MINRALISARNTPSILSLRPAPSQPDSLLLAQLVMGYPSILYDTRSSFVGAAIPRLRWVKSRAAVTMRTIVGPGKQGVLPSPNYSYLSSHLLNIRFGTFECATAVDG